VILGAKNAGRMVGGGRRLRKGGMAFRYKGRNCRDYYQCDRDEERTERFSHVAERHWTTGREMHDGERAIRARVTRAFVARLGNEMGGDASLGAPARRAPMRRRLALLRGYRNRVRCVRGVANLPLSAPSLVSTHIRVNCPQTKCRGDDEEGETRGVIPFDWKECELRRNEGPPIDNGSEPDCYDASLDPAGKTGHNDSRIEGQKPKDIGPDERERPVKRCSKRDAKNCKQHFWASKQLSPIYHPIY
jgi:hypothetical protein